MFKSFVFAILLFFFGCASPYQLTVDDYMAAYPKISLGQSKQKIIEILTPSQKRLSSSEIKQPDIYKKEGVLVEILYFRRGV